MPNLLTNTKTCAIMKMQKGKGKTNHNSRSLEQTSTQEEMIWKWWTEKFSSKRQWKWKLHSLTKLARWPGGSRRIFSLGIFWARKNWHSHNSRRASLCKRMTSDWYFEAVWVKRGSASRKMPQWKRHRNESALQLNRERRWREEAAPTGIGTHLKYAGHPIDEEKENSGRKDHLTKVNEKRLIF